MCHRSRLALEWADHMGDKLRTLSVEYDLPEELLVNVAVKRLVDDIEFVRDLRIGKTEGA